MNESQKASRFVNGLMHDAHLRHQREQLKPADARLSDGSRLASPEVRGVKRETSVSERKAHEWKPEWFSHLRPNFWKAYFETLLACSKG